MQTRRLRLGSAHSRVLLWITALCISFAAAALLAPSNLGARSLAVPAGGNSYVVNSTADVPDPDPANPMCAAANGQCTLRAAVQDANFAGGVHTITLPAGVYVLTRPGYDDNALVGDLDIKHGLTIQGAGSGATIVDGNGAVTGDRVFQILSSANAVTLTGLTIRHGHSLSSTVGVIGGGGLYMEGAGHLQLRDVIVENSTGQNGGGLYANFSAQGGSLEMDQVILRGNTAIAGGVGAGGGLFAHLPDSSLGGAVVQDSRVYSNTADGTAGGIYVDGNSSGYWLIRRSELYSNTAASGGAIGNFVPLGMFDSFLHDNRVTLDGGAIEAFAPFALTRTTLEANAAGRFGGGIFDLQTSGSALYPDFAHIAQSTLSGNSAQYGGGIYHDGFIHPESLVTLLNSTLSGNVVFRPLGATGRADGGGIYVYSGQAQLLNATVASNRVQLRFPPTYPGLGGGLYITASATFTAVNSVIADNTRGNGINLDVQDDCFSSGTVGTLAYNLILTTTNCFVSGPQGGNIVAQDPRLGPLANNGGTTPTRALLVGSPAIDAGAPAGCTDDLGAPLTTDQRGVPRPFNAVCDMGAYEFATNVGQAITFGPIPDKSLTNSPFVITATSSSGLTVTFGVNTPSICGVSGSSLNFLGVSAATVTLHIPGKCTLVAQQPGDVTFNPATPVTRTFNVRGLFLPLVVR